MANIKQQKKRILTDQKKKIANSSFKSQIRTTIKKINLAIINKVALADLSPLVNYAIKLLDKSLYKKIHKTNFVNRQKKQILSKFHLFVHQTNGNKNNLKEMDKD